MAEKVSTLKRNILYGLLCWKKILHRQVVNVRKKNYNTRGLGKKNFNQTKSPITPPSPLPLRQSQMVCPSPNFLAAMGYQFL